MAHSHAGPDNWPDDGTRPSNQARTDRRQAAIRLMVVVLIPIAIWTLVALIVMWPDDIADHIRKDVSTASAEGLTLPKGHVSAIKESSCDGLEGSVPDDSSICATLTVQLDQGPELDQEVEVPIQAARYASGVEIGNKVVLYRVPGVDGIANYSFAEFDRSVPLLVITLIFVLAVVAVARLRGLLSLVGLGFAAFILVKFMFPALVAGANPIMVGLVGGSAIMFVVLYAAHGFSARTTTALIGTLFGLGLSAGLGWIATRWAHLTGVTGEDDYLLSATAPDLKLTSVVICAVIVAGLGVLNDVTITQASAVWELADSSGDHKRLFSRAMRIGRDHIASTVYTIAFATAGASLGTLLLISIFDRPVLDVIQGELFATEIIRTLVGSIALVMAVPLTTVIGVAVVKVSTRNDVTAVPETTMVSDRSTHDDHPDEHVDRGLIRPDHQD